MKKCLVVAALLSVTVSMLACAGPDYDALDERLEEIQNAKNYTWTRTEFGAGLLGDVTITEKHDGESVYRRSETHCLLIEEYRVQEDDTMYSYARWGEDSTWMRSREKVIDVEPDTIIGGLQAGLFEYEDGAYVLDATRHPEAFGEDAEMVEELQIEFDRRSLTLIVVKSEDDSETTYEWVFTSIGSTEFDVPDFEEDDTDS